MARRVLPAATALAVIGLAVSIVVLVRVATRTQPTGPVPSLSTSGRYTSGHLPSATAQDAVAAAVREVPILLSYDYQDLSGSLQRALAQTTGSFTASFRSTFTTTVQPQATTDEDIATSSVRGASYVGSSGARVTCLVFVDQSLQRGKPSAGSPAHQVDEDRVVVTMTKAGGQWRVSSLTPV